MDGSTAATLRSRTIRAAIQFLEVVHGDLAGLPDVVASMVNPMEPEWTDWVMDSYYAPRYRKQAVLSVDTDAFARWRKLPEYETFVQTFRENSWLADQEDTIIAVAGADSSPS